LQQRPQLGQAQARQRLPQTLAGALGGVDLLGL